MHGIPFDSFELFQSVFIVASFLISASSLILAIYGFRRDKRSRKVQNYLRTGENYGNLWEKFANHGALARILNPVPDLINFPVTEEEQTVVAQFIRHLDGAFVAQRAGEMIKIEGMDMDVEDFFAKPIPRVVWKSIRKYQNADFRNYMDRLIGVEE